MIYKDWVGNDLSTKHIYLTYVDEYIGAYNPHTGEVVGYETSDKFCDFVTNILHNFPDYSPHNVMNCGIQEEIRKKIKKDKLEQNLYILKDKER